MAVTRTRDLGIEQGVEEVAVQWLPYLVERLGYQLTKN